MYITKEKINERAVKIAAQIMEKLGLCRYDNVMKCRKVLPPTPMDCTGCIKRFLEGKAKRELEREASRKKVMGHKED